MHGPEQVLAQMPDLLRIGNGSESCLGFVLLHGEYHSRGVVLRGSQSVLASPPRPSSAMSGQARSKSNSRGHYGIYLSATSWKYRGIIIGICCTPDLFDLAFFLLGSEEPS